MSFMLSEMFSASDTRRDPSLFVCSGGGLTGSDKKPDADLRLSDGTTAFQLKRKSAAFRIKVKGFYASSDHRVPESREYIQSSI